MIADADGEALPGSVEFGDCAIVDLQQFASVTEEGCAPRRKLHVPRRPLDQPAAEPFLETFQLETDRALRRPHRLSREREAAKLRDANESVHGVQVEGGFYHFQL
jgi:hypothetical protein